MRYAIQVLEKRILKIHSERAKNEKIMDEPKMMSDYIFAQNEIGNLEIELQQLQRAIGVLNGLK